MLLLSDAHWTEQMQRNSCVHADLAPLRHYQWFQRLAKVCPRSCLDLSLVVFLGEKSRWGTGKSLSWQHCGHLYYTPLSLTAAAAHAFSNIHTCSGISGPRPIRGGVCPSLFLIGLDHDMSLMCVCCLTTGRLSESQRLFFLFLNGWSHRCDLRFFLVAPLRN